MKRGCLAFVAYVIVLALILVTLYQCVKWEASPGVLTPRATTREADLSAEGTPGTGD